MSYPKTPSRVVLFFLLIVFLQSCGLNQTKKATSPNSNGAIPGSMTERVSDDLEKLIEYAAKNTNKINDTTSLGFAVAVDSAYVNNKYLPLWSKDEQWQPLADSLFNFIQKSKNYGLFPNDYHYRSLAFIHRVFDSDSLTKKNPALWARADVLLTDAFFLLVKHLKQGRLDFDSVTLRTDTLLPTRFFLQTMATALQSGGVTPLFHHLEPLYKGYDSLKAYLPGFLAKADFSQHTYLVYPYQDSIAFFKSLEKRFHELNLIAPSATGLDTLAFIAVIRKYQKEQGFKVTGHLSDLLVDKFNDTDIERFKRIAINMDRYKLLPDTLPTTYVWVNLPSYTMSVFDHDTLVFKSRIIVGGPTTRTPLLTSEISNFITLPQWTVPYSIIFKEMLPAIQKNVEYLDKENLMIVDRNDSVLDPRLINWKKFNRNHFPYLIKQKQGDENSLGVIKFNFRNKYSVYMHDTNVRWLFSKSFRALSHGCVRIREWQKLANFLIRNDTLRYQPDTLKAWIKRQEKHMVSGFPKMPLYIRYFTCEGQNRNINFFDDIYQEDRTLREKYFAKKSVD
jgi:L,D-transpeptidase YcbB